MFSLFHAIAHDLLMQHIFVALVLMAPTLWASRKLRTSISRGKRLWCWTIITVEAASLVFGASGFVIEGHEIGELAKKNECELNIRQISYAVSQYMQDSDETCPPANKWGDLVSPYLNKLPENAGKSPADVQKAWHCPVATTPFSYAFNSNLGSISLAKVSDPTITFLLFENDANTRNANGDENSVPREARHFGCDSYAFMDGHQSSLYRLRPNMGNYRWLP